MLRLVTIGLSFGLAGACGSSDSSLDSKKISEVTAAESGEVCDAIMVPQGGYGRSVVCADGHTERTAPTRELCITTMPDMGEACPDLTVGESVACSKAIGQDLCAFTTAPECAAARSCN
jgi:hypothetical protein